MPWKSSHISSSQPRALVGVIIVVVAGTVFGCTEPGEPSVPPPGESLDSQCTADGECAEGAFCLEGLCGVAPAQSDVEYGIVVRPPERSDFPPQIIDAAVRPVVGAEASAGHSEVISGELTTTDGEPAPDGTLVVASTESSLLPERQRPVRSGEFELHVVPGDYRLTYIVDDDRWPRIPLDVHNLSDDISPLQLTIPTFPQLRTITGELIREPLELLGILTAPVEGAEVVARATESGHRSQVATTDEDGEFALHLPPGDDDFDVLISPGPDNPIVPYATFDGEIDADTDDISISLGGLDFELLSVDLKLSAEAIAGYSPDWRNIRVDFHRFVDIGELLVTPVLDDDGSAVVDLVPGSYDIEITPAPGAPWGAATDTINVLDSLVSVEIELPLRPRLQGAIIDADGEPVSSARIRATPESDPSMAPPAVYSDRDGNFELWLEPGSYELTVRPPASTALPRYSESLSIASGDEIFVDVELRRGVIATGRIQASDGTALSHAAIEIFDDESADTPMSYGITAEDGSYRVVIPQ